MLIDIPVRTRENILQTPIYELENPYAASKIGFVGMIHLGQQEYYDQIGKYVSGAQAQGANVHYEMIKPADDSTDQSKEQLAFTDSIGFVVDLLAKNTTDSVKQKEALKYGDDWQNHDASITDVMTLLGDSQLSKTVTSIENVKNIENEMSPEMLGKIMRGSLKLMPLIITARRLVGNNEFNKVIVDYRNEIALQAVRDQIAINPDQSITMLWGAAHAPGIIKGLKEMGYRQSSKTWLNALSLAR